MKENKIYFQLTVRKFCADFNKSSIFTYNEVEKAYERYTDFRRMYNELEAEEKSRVSIELYVIDRSSLGVKQITTVVACGYGILDNYIEDAELFNEIVARYCNKKEP
jgi:hypothetical protein